MNSGIKIKDNGFYREACLCFEKKMKLKDISEKTNVTRQTLSKWKVKWEIEGTPLKYTDGAKEIEKSTIIEEGLSVNSKNQLAAIKRKIPSMLLHLLKRILITADNTEDVLKLAAAFEKIAPYVMPKIDPKDEDGGVESERTKFYNNIFLQLNQPNNGQQETITDIRHTEEPPTRE